MRLPLCPQQKKISYPTKRMAIGAAIKSSRKRGVALRVYWHAECRSYHLTKSSRVDIENGRAA